MHIGFPRCGSTWLWKNILPLLDQQLVSGDKENMILFKTADINQYCAHYNKYQISANMNPNLWMIDQSIIQSLNNCTTHVSCILRNPYEFIERYYNFLPDSNDNGSKFVDFVISQGMLQYYNIYCRWNNNFTGKLKFFYFDDLKKDGVEFYRQILEFYDFDANQVSIPATVNCRINTNSASKGIRFTKSQIAIINREIDSFSKLINLSLTHWLR